MLIARLLDGPASGGTAAAVGGHRDVGSHGDARRGEPASADAAEDAAVDAVRMLALSAWPGPDPALLVTVGAARGNPLAELLGSGLAAAGIAAVQVRDLATARLVADRVGAATGGRARVGVHLHWLHRLVEATTEAGADRAADRVAADLAALRAAGVGLLWTVHNVFPHDAPHPAVQLRLRRLVAAAVDLVHVLEPATTRLTEELFTIRPGTVRRVPHPGWQGVYPDTVSTARARARLGLPATALVLLLFGRLSADKGVADVVEAFTAPGPPPLRPGTRLLLAGRPARDPDARTAAALELAARHPLIDLWAARVPDADVQLFLRAADIAVTAHRRPLNSGVRTLALTFGLPLVAAVEPSPAEPSPAGTCPAGTSPAGTSPGEPPAPPVAHLRTFPAGDTGALRAALSAADPALTTPAARESALAAAAAVHPRLVAPLFTAVVRELLGLAAPARDGVVAQR